MKNVLLKSPAKVNLFLKIGKKIKSKKYHNIQSLIFPINLNDEISISETNKTKDIVKKKIGYLGDIKINISPNKRLIFMTISLVIFINVLSIQIYNLDFNGDVSQWDVSAVTSMAFMFSSAEYFNGDVSKWDVSAVTDMRNMFYYQQ